jgi:hypothetical protein
VLEYGRQSVRALSVHVEPSAGLLRSPSGVRNVECGDWADFPKEGFMVRRLAPLLVAVALAPRPADAAVLIEGFYGLARPPAADFSAAVDSAQQSSDLADSSQQIYGGDILINLGGFQFGAIVDTTSGDVAEQTAIGGLAGFRFGDKLRFDLLGELGGQRFGNVFEDTDVVSASTEDQWLMYVGLRPGIAYRFGGPESMGVVVGVWGFARWDLTDGNTRVDAGEGVPSPGDVDLGGTTIGATLRLGLEF